MVGYHRRPSAGHQFIPEWDPHGDAAWNRELFLHCFREQLQCARRADRAIASARHQPELPDRRRAFQREPDLLGRHAFVFRRQRRERSAQPGDFNYHCLSGAAVVQRDPRQSLGSRLALDRVHPRQRGGERGSNQYAAGNLFDQHWIRHRIRHAGKSASDGRRDIDGGLGQPGTRGFAQFDSDLQPLGFLHAGDWSDHGPEHGLRRSQFHCHGLGRPPGCRSTSRAA